MKLQGLKSNNTNNIACCVLFQGCAQVSLADFSPESVSVKWYNILSFRFMQPPSDMTGTNLDALPPLPQLLVGNTDIGKETQSTVGCQDEERSNNNQGSEVSVFNKQVASLKEESSDDSTVISSQTSTLTRSQGTVIWSTVGYKFQALEILPFAVFSLAGYFVTFSVDKDVQRMEENRIPKRVLYMNLETRQRGRPRNRWQDEVREDGRVGREKSGRKKYMVGRNGRSCIEWQGMVTFCTCQWNRIV
jgi:hypothetical protein